MEVDWKEIRLSAQEMLRFECISTTQLQLIEGTAELFGSELSTKAILELQPSYRGTILTFHGCKLKYTKNTVIDYTIPFSEDQELPNIYLNIHSGLENLRNCANNDVRGPRLMVIGNKSVGKTTLCRTLANYAARKYRKIVLIDANVGLNDISIPGCTSSLIITKPYEINEGWDIYEDPLVYCLGHINIFKNLKLFLTHLETLIENVNVRSENDPELFAGGCIINFTGIDKTDYGVNNQTDCVKAINAAVNIFEVNALVIIEDGFLEMLIKPNLPDYVSVFRIPKSSGALTRTEQQWDKSRSASIYSYFHGRGCYKLEPHKLILRSENYQIYKIEYKKYGDCLLPVSEGKKSSSGSLASSNPDTTHNSANAGSNKADEDENSNITITKVPFAKTLTNYVLAISEAETEDQLITSSILGFFAVLGVIVMDPSKSGAAVVPGANPPSSGISVLSPSQEEPPSHGLLILTSIRYVDNI